MIVIVSVPIEVNILISRLEKEQPKIFQRVAPYLEAAFFKGIAADQLQLIKILNEGLNSISLPEMTIRESCIRWLKALDAMIPEEGSTVNPKPIIIHSTPTTLQ